MAADGNSTTHYEDLRRSLSAWRKRTLALLWVVYACFYLCRVNLAAAQQSLAASQGVTKQELGWILALMKALYATGQFVNGTLADRFGPRRLMVTGLAVSAALNLTFAHLSDFRLMALTWAANGYFQACGWTPVVRTIANWFPTRLRDAASGVIGTSYVLGSGFSWLLAGRVTESWGWRYAFWAPAWVCLVVAALVLLTIKPRPEDVGLGGIDEDTPASPSGPSSRPGWQCALTSPQLWMLAIANLALIYGYHGMLDWTPHYLAEVGKVASGAAATQAFVMPLGGATGCIVLTVVARRTGKRMGRRAVVVPLVALAALMYAFPAVAESAPRLVPLALFVLGALSSGPATLMACAMPANIATAEGAGTAAGVVDASAYVGSALSSWSSGRIMDSVARSRGTKAAWTAVWHVWPAGVLISGGLVALSQGRRTPAGGPASEGDRP